MGVFATLISAVWTNFSWKRLSDDLLLWGNNNNKSESMEINNQWIFMNSNEIHWVYREYRIYIEGNMWMYFLDNYVWCVTTIFLVLDNSIPVLDIYIWLWDKYTLHMWMYLWLVCMKIAESGRGKLLSVMCNFKKVVAKYI